MKESLLSQFMLELGSDNEEIRMNAAKNLRIYAETEGREMLGVTFGKFMDDLSNRIHQLIKHGSSYQQLGGLCALEELIDVHTNFDEDKEVKNMRFMTFLRFIFQHRPEGGGPIREEQHLTLLRASQALGHIARSGQNWNRPNLLQYELKSSFDWLKTDARDEYHRLAAVLILKELAINSPVLFTSHISDFFNDIWVALQDPHSQKIRMAAIDALHAAIQILLKRDDASILEKWFTIMWNKVRSGLRGLDASVVDGSLLVLGELLDPSNSLEVFMLQQFDEACFLVFEFVSSRHKAIQRTVIRLLPVLARSDPERFTANEYLKKAMNHLLGYLNRNENEQSEFREMAFNAVGDVTSAVSSKISTFVDSIVPHVHAALDPKRLPRRNNKEMGDALLCISKLIKAMGPSFQPYIESLISEMFAGGLSETLLDTLQQLVDSIPMMLPVVQEKLNQCVTEMLSQLNTEVKFENEQSAVEWSSKREAFTILALTALGRFGISATESHSNIIDYTLCFLEHPNGGIRLKAALTICKLLFPKHGKYHEEEAAAAVEKGDQAIVFEYFSNGEIPRNHKCPIKSEHFRYIEAPQNFIKSQSTNIYKSGKRENPLINHEGHSDLSSAAVAYSNNNKNATTLLQRDSDAILSSLPLRVLEKDSIKSTDLRRNFGVNTSGGPPSSNSHHRVYMSKAQFIESLRIIQRLIVYAISEPIMSNRLAFLESLDPMLYAFLCDPVCIAAIAQALYDESFQVRVLAVKLMGRLSYFQPESVVYGLKNLLLQLLSELEYSDDCLEMKESIELIEVLLVSSPYLTQPFFPVVLKQLSKQLKDFHYGRDRVSSRKSMSDTLVTSKRPYDEREGHVPVPFVELLEVIGTFSEVATQDVIAEQLHTILPILIESYQDTSGRYSNKVVIFKTLSNLISNSGYVVSPYHEYVSLLPNMISLLRNPTYAMDPKLRKEVIRAIGSIGALDPTTFYEIAAKMEAEKSAGDAVTKAAPQTATWPSSARFDKTYLSNSTTLFRFGKNTKTAAEMLDTPVDHRFTGMDKLTARAFYSRRAVSALLKILHDPAQSDKHPFLTQGIFYIFKSMRYHCTPYLPYVIPTFLQQLQIGDPRTHHALLIQIAEFINISKLHVEEYLPLICNCISDALDHLVYRASTASLHATKLRGTPPISYGSLPVTADTAITYQTILSSAAPYASVSPSLLPRYENQDVLLITSGILQVLEALIQHARDAVKPYINNVARKLMALIQHGKHMNIELAETILSSLQTFGNALQNDIFLIIPTLTKMFEAEDTCASLRCHIVDTIGHLVRTCDFPLMVGRIIHPLLRSLESPSEPKELKEGILKTLNSLNDAYGPDVALFLPLMRSIASRNIMEIPFTFDEFPLNFSSKGEHRPPDSSHSGVLAGHGNSSSFGGISTGLNASQSSREDLLKPSNPHSTVDYTYGNDNAKHIAFGNSSSADLQSDEQEIAKTNKSKFKRLLVQRSAMDLQEGRHHVAAPITGRKPPHNSGSGVSNIQRRVGGRASNTGMLEGYSSYSDLLHFNDEEDVNSETHELIVNQSELKAVWDRCNCTCAEEWTQWLNRLGLQLIKESPSPAIRACFFVSQNIPHIVEELFNVAFLSCWQQLDDAHQYELARHALSKALLSPHLSPSSMQQILNLTEFMEHCEEFLPIDSALLARVAETYYAFAKALHYKELEWVTQPENCVETLISLNSQLQQNDEAQGVLIYAQKNLDVALKESWYEKLNRWEDALQAYEIRQLDDCESLEWAKGKMRCLHALDEWERLSCMISDVWKRNEEVLQQDANKRIEIARIGAAAEFNIRNWEKLEAFVKELECCGTFESYFYLAVLCIQKAEFTAAEQHICSAREKLDPEFTTLLAEGYTRAYPAFVKVQQLTELEEVIRYQTAVDVEKRRDIQMTWNARLKGCQRNVDVWRSTLQVRAMVLSPAQDLPAWLKFASLCRKQNRLSLAVKVLAELRENPYTKNDLRVTFSHLKNLYAAGRKAEACEKLKWICEKHSLFSHEELRVCKERGDQIIDALAFEIPAGNVAPFGITEIEGVEEEVLPMIDGSSDAQNELIASNMKMGIDSAGKMEKADFLCLLSKYHLKLGLWEKEREESRALRKSLDDEVLQEVLSWLQTSIYLNELNYNAWDAWALTNFQLAQAVESSKGRMDCCGSYKADHTGGLQTHREIVLTEQSIQRQETQLYMKQEGRTDPPRSLLTSLPRMPSTATTVSEIEGDPPHVKHSNTITSTEEETGMKEGTVETPLSNDKTCCYEKPNIPRRSIYVHHEHFVIEATRALLKSMYLQPQRSCLQDVLRILMLWFKHPSLPELEYLLREGFDLCPMVKWLDVIPQLLARLSSTSESLRDLLCYLLVCIGKEYPQALVFPLTVANKSSRKELSASSHKLLQDLQAHSPRLVSQSKLVSEELIRVSVLWQEQWYKGLEEASRLYYAEGNCDGMVQTLEPLHRMITNEAQTLMEMAFIQNFGRELNQAHCWVKQYTKSRKKSDLDQAWQHYYKIFTKLYKLINKMHQLDLHNSSPKLLEAYNLELAVPGTYQPDKWYPTIKCFVARIKVFDSKQKPRKLQIEGSDGVLHKYLLKGHEDLKQDERVMQVLGLINHLLHTNEDAAIRCLFVPRFTVIPLSSNAGLIEWVDDCDTLHNLIRQYREARNINLSLEHNLMKSFYSKFEELTVLQKVEVFRYASNNSSGDDLRKILWLQSETSEVWLKRRANFCQSLAIMSMVGYILGLGDRHPSNLMLMRASGHIVHIDFGDCFEVAKFREKFPEKIPFRLTRMLLNAMDVAGVEGKFRLTCERVMNVMRKNKDTVMAMLEAFVYDPLITWRLLLPHKKRLELLREETMASTVSPSSVVQTMETSNVTSSYKSTESLSSVNEAHRSLVQKIVRMDANGKLRITKVHSKGVKFLNFVEESTSMERPLEEMEDTGASESLQPIERGESVKVHESTKNSQYALHEWKRELKKQEMESDRIDPSILPGCARLVIERVERKLNGMDFHYHMSVALQVDRLVKEATSEENLSQCYVGWCAFW